MVETDARRYRENMQGEVDSARLYRALGSIETDPRLAEVYNRLAGMEEQHAALWRKRLAALGEPARKASAGLRTRALIWLARRFGPEFVSCRPSIPSNI
jgi:rubrerythrin